MSLTSSQTPCLTCPSDDKVIIAKGNVIIIYITAIVLFVIVAALGMYLFNKSLKSIYNRAIDDIGLKNIGQVVTTMLATNAEISKQIISELSFKVYPSETSAFFILVDMKGNILLDTSSETGTPNNISVDMKKVNANQGFMYLPNQQLGTIVAYVSHIEKLNAYLLTCRIVSNNI